MAQCEISGIKRMVGNNVSHANNRTKRVFKANIQRVKIVDENGTVRHAYVSTRVLKKGLVSKAPSRKVQLALAGEKAKAKK